MANTLRPPAPKIKSQKKQPGPLSVKPGTKTKVTPHPTPQVFQERAARRLARLRTHDEKALPGIQPSAHGRFTKSQRVAILGAIRNLNKQKTPTKTPSTKEAAPYNPLAPISGKAFEDELAANEKLQFGDQDTELANRLAAQGRNEAITGSAYDQYRSALAEAAGRIKAVNDANAAASQTAVDTAYTQDKSAAEARDKAAADEAARQGLTVGASATGAQAVEAQRSQGNQAVAFDRSQGSAENALMEKRGATSVLQKAEALGRERSKRDELGRLGQQLAEAKGAFRTSERGKLTERERTYALARKEFGLKAADVASQINTRKAQVSADKQKANAQVIVAKLYSAANKAQAKAQIRVAQLQLEKGKISKHQYRTIINVYKGLPKKGSASQPKGSSGGGSGQGGSGAGGSLAPWEVDAQDRATRGFTNNHYGKDDKLRAIEKAVKAGIPQRLAERAWKQYVKSLTTPYDNRPRG